MPLVIYQPVLIFISGALAACQPVLELVISMGFILITIPSVCRAYYPLTLIRRGDGIIGSISYFLREHLLFRAIKSRSRCCGLRFGPAISPPWPVNFAHGGQGYAIFQIRAEDGQNQ